MRCVPLTLLVLGLLASTAGATIAVRVNVNDLTDDATIVVRGTVKSVRAAWTEDKRTIQTLVTLEVEKVLKGAADEEVTVACPGGTIGNRKVDVSGVPKFAKGERVLVFLWKDKYGQLIPLALNQGKFRIEKDAETGEETAKNSLEGLAFVVPTDEKGERRPVKRTPDSFRLADLEKKVKDRLEFRAKVEAAKKAAEEKKAAEAEKKKEAAKEDKPAPKEDKPPVTEPGKPDPGKKVEEPPVEPKKPADEPKKRSSGDDSPPDDR